MIWLRKDPAEDRFVKFGHQEQRIAALEADMKSLALELLAYLDTAYDVWTRLETDRLVRTLRKIIESHAKK